MRKILLSLCEDNRPRIRWLIAFTSLTVCVTVLWLSYVTQWRVPSAVTPMVPFGVREVTSSLEELRLGCQDVLRNMVKGRWEQHEMTAAQQYQMKMFHMSVRVAHNLPTGLQRPDLQCGNVTFGPFAPIMHPLLWYRALCDEEGTTPCCYENRCQAKSKEECRCPQCYDNRNAIQAEFSTWRPADEGCVVQAWSQGQICRLLDGARLYFIGDSFVRHVYTALLLAARDNNRSGALALHTPPGIKSSCLGIYMFTEKICRHWLDTEAILCGGRTRVRFFEHVYIKQALGIHQTVLELVNVTKSFVFIGTGIHDDYKALETQDQVLKPLLKQLQNVTYPRLLWAATHAPGLLKTPRIPAQSYDSVMRYNRAMAKFLKDWNVPVFDTFNMTDGVMSFDGAHYGFGVNRVKVQVLLAYLLELLNKKMW